MITIIRPNTKTGRYNPKQIAKAAPRTEARITPTDHVEVPLKSDNGETLVVAMDIGAVDQMYRAAHGIKSGKAAVEAR